MKRLILYIICVILVQVACADNFVIPYGQSVKIYQGDTDREGICQRADRLLGQDYHEALGGYLIHTPHIEDARIIAATYDNSELRKYAKLRGISFEELADKPQSYILRVNNNGRQLFIVGGSAQATAFAMMSLSREWGVSPFGEWLDAPALPIEQFELDVVYLHQFQPSVPVRKLHIPGADVHDARLQDLLLRLRVTDLVTDALPVVAPDATPVVGPDGLPVVDPDALLAQDAAAAEQGVFAWTFFPSAAPYKGLNLALEHPERLRIEGVRAISRGCKSQWTARWLPQYGGELQLAEFFEMAWDTDAYRDPYAVEKLMDQHYGQMSGVLSNWSLLWNDYFDLALRYRLDEMQSVETLRRGIGESQSLALQLSMELNERPIKKAYANSFFRAIEYPVNMLTSQMQRLCHTQLYQLNGGNLWTIEDCLHRMQLLAREMNERMTVKWRQYFGAILMNETQVEQSAIHLHGVAPDESQISLLYRSDRGFGTQIKPFEPLHLPLNYKADQLHLRMALLPSRGFGKPVICTVTVDNGAYQTIVIDPSHLAAGQQQFEMTFEVDPSLESHKISFRTTNDGIYLQRVWLLDVK